MTYCPSVNRELALIKINAKPNQRGELFQVAEVFRAKVMDVGQSTMIIEITGANNKIDDFVALLTPFNILEIARSGIVSMERGKKLKK